MNYIHLKRYFKIKICIPIKSNFKNKLLNNKSGHKTHITNLFCNLHGYEGTFIITKLILNTDVKQYLLRKCYFTQN